MAVLALDLHRAFDQQALEEQLAALRAPILFHASGHTKLYSQPHTTYSTSNVIRHQDVVDMSIKVL